jgi:hypothetical protein
MMRASNRGVWSVPVAPETYFPYGDSAMADAVCSLELRRLIENEL